MSDLISRKSMIDILKGVDQEGLLTIRQIIEFIEDRPSAFDKEKVIEKLKGEIELCVTHPLFPGRYIKKKRAIEIVEKGGIE